MWSVERTFASLPSVDDQNQGRAGPEEEQKLKHRSTSRSRGAQGYRRGTDLGEGDNINIHMFSERAPLLDKGSHLNK